MDKARYNASRALEIDPLLPEAHTSMGMIKLKYDWEWQEAERQFKLALELNPEYAPAHYGYASLLVVMGRFDEALQQSEVARSLDPYSPLSIMNYGRVLYYARRRQDAADYFGRMLQDKPDYPQYLHLMGLVLIQQGKYPEAIATLERLRSKDPLHADAALGYAYGKAGRQSDALRMVEELDKPSKDKPVPPHEKALIYIGLGDRDAAFTLLEEAYQERFSNLIYLTTDPIYDDLRGDPRFANLVRRIGLSL
jgi:tetratricopeptide (TPR) repeat protein